MFTSMFTHGHSFEYFSLFRHALVFSNFFLAELLLLHLLHLGLLHLLLELLLRLLLILLRVSAKGLRLLLEGGGSVVCGRGGHHLLLGLLGVLLLLLR